MNSSITFVILPIVALLVGSLSIAAIWLWWSMSSEEIEEDAVDGEDIDEAGDDLEDKADGRSAPADPTLGDIGEKIKGFVAGVMNRGEAAGRSGGVSLASILPSAKPSGDPTHSAYPSAATGVSAVDPAGTVPVMRVLRDIADGRIVIEMDGRRYRSLSEMTDPEVRRRFLGNAHALVSWTKESAPPASASAPVAPASSAPPPDATMPPVPGPSPVPASMPAPAVDDDEAGEEKSMAAQIEELLQVRLLQDQEYKGRSIHIRPSTDGGVVIMVDGTYYDGVGDVAEEDVREFILEVIREWEARQ